LSRQGPANEGLRFPFCEDIIRSIRSSQGEIVPGDAARRGRLHFRFDFIEDQLMAGDDEGRESRLWTLGQKRWNEMSPPQQARLSRMLGLGDMDEVYAYLGQTTDGQHAKMLIRLDSRP
jgi:hypothetical protein